MFVSQRASRCVALPVFLVALTGWLASARAEEAKRLEKEPAKYVRYADDGQTGGKLETAAVTYRNADGATVRLVAAIHIGEHSYFDNLNKSFENDDAVLYELVKDKDARLPKPGEPRKQDENAKANPIGDFQRMLKDVLNLDFQLDVIDYTKPNFVHADLDRETFEKMQAERGESFATLMLKQLMNAMNDPKAFEAAAGEQPSLKDLVKTLTRPDGERQVKIFIAKQMDQMEDMAAGLDGPDGSVILTERNKAAMKALSDTLAGGKKHVSVFYGAAHMPDLAKRLGAMGFEPVAIEWNAAWDLSIRPDQPSAVEKLLLEALDLLGSGE